MQSTSQVSHLYRYGISAMLAFLALLMCIGTPAQAQFDQEAKHEARRKNAEITNRSEALGAILRARAELDVYDRLMAVKPADQRDSGLLFELNDLRFSILKKAIDAYIRTGPVTLPAEDDELFAALSAEDVEIGMHAWPSALDDVVKSGIISHLPASPYSSGEWLTAAPTADPQPGSVLYLAWSPRKLVWHDEPALECNLLVVFGETDPSNALTKEQAQEYFLGDLLKTMPYFPSNVKYLSGVDYDS
jgi:hypothetical protein